MTDVPAATAWVQPSLDELGEPLCDVTFVVVDLETTGSSAEDSITEIGAVKVRGGEVIGEFETLVNPGAPMPPFVSVLTGITDTMLAPAPRLETVLPAFLEFAKGSVLVAHNAPFDVGFLKSACAGFGYPWPGFRVVDTAALARRVLTRDEAPSCRLSTLAALLGARTTPCHRALADARATVDVLHSLIERVGNIGVQTLDELVTFTYQVTEAQRRKRHLAAHLPSTPGVYVFRDARDRALYVGTSNNIRARVRRYFVSSERRTRMAEMIAAAERVEALRCAHSLEAEVRELRIIAAHKPPYNRRSKFPERVAWLALTDETYPRLSVVRAVRDDRRSYLGPFSTRRGAQDAMAAVHEALLLRRCSTRLTLRRTSPACVLAEIGRCRAPCEHRESVESYRTHADAFRSTLTGDPAPVVEPVLAKVARLADAGRYEDAAVQRDRLVAYLRAVVRMQRLAALTRVREVVAAKPDGDGGWELSVVRYGRLVAAAHAPRGAHPVPYVDALRATAETPVPGPGPTPCASAEETERVLAWLERPETRMVQVSDPWTAPIRGAERWRDLLDRVRAARLAADPLAERRVWRTVERPARAAV